MHIEITEEGRTHRIALPRFLYMNDLTASAAALFGKADISPRQARAALHAVKKAVREHGLTSICDVTIVSDEPDGSETTVSIRL